MHFNSAEIGDAQFRILRDILSKERYYIVQRALNNWIRILFVEAKQDSFNLYSTNEEREVRKSEEKKTGEKREELKEEKQGRIIRKRV